MLKEKVITIMEELELLLAGCSYETTEELIVKIVKAHRIYIAGVGRAGYVMRGFSMRLMHGGYAAYVIGDTETPAACAGDLLIIGSGSGETESLKAYEKKARGLGLDIVVITSSLESTLAGCADIVMQLPAPTKIVSQKEGQNSAQPMGSLFEQALMLYTDALILELIEKGHMDCEMMVKRHANLE